MWIIIIILIKVNSRLWYNIIRQWYFGFCFKEQSSRTYVGAGGKLPVANPNTNGLQDKRFAETIIFTNLKKCFLIHEAQNNTSFGFILYVSGSGSVNSDCGLYICGTTYEGGGISCRYIYGTVPAGMKLGSEVRSDGSIGVYVYTDSTFGAYRMLKKSVHESSNGFMVDESSKDLSSIKQLEIIR